MKPKFHSFKPWARQVLPVLIFLGLFGPLLLEDTFPPVGFWAGVVWFFAFLMVIYKGGNFENHNP